MKRVIVTTAAILAAGLQPTRADIRKLTCAELFSYVDGFLGTHKVFSQSELERLLGKGMLAMSAGDLDQAVAAVWTCEREAESSVPQDARAAARSAKLADLYTVLQEWLDLLYWHSMVR